MTFDNGDVNIYIDGALDATQAGMVIPQIGLSPVSLAREKAFRGFTGKYYAGEMDEVRVWSIVRRQQQIRAHMDKKISPNMRGLIAYWRLDEGTGDVAADITSNGHDMQLGNSAGADAGDPTWVAPGKL